MRRFIISALLLLCASRSFAQSTFLELGLHWGTYSGPGVTNATTVLKNSTGTVIATRTNNAFPTIAVPMGLDVYTVILSAPALNGNPALNWTFSLPMATVIPIVNGNITVNSYVASIAIDTTGQHGTIKATISAAF